MNNWRDGYVTDTEYTTAYYSQHSPVTIDAAHFFQRYRPVRNGPEFRYFELGCGTGLTTNLMAAGHPEAYFEANDFMPEHIVVAQDVASKLGLENVRFTDESFEQLNRRQHEPYDYILAHGIYTWISEANKAEIRTFVGDNIKPGGNFSVTYNCRAGWAGFENVFTLFQAYLAEETDRRDPEVAKNIFRKIQRLFEVNEGFFKPDSKAAKFVADIIDSKHDPRYLLHEYGNDYWNPRYSAEVIAEMQAQKLSYAGSPSILLNMPETCLPSRVQEHLSKTKETIDRQTLIDLSLDSTFRQDLYRRGIVRLDMGQIKRLYGDLVFTLAKPLEDCKLTVKIASGEMTLNETIHGGMLRLAEQGGKKLKDFFAFGQRVSISSSDVLDCLGVLYGVGYLQMGALHTPDVAYFDRLNHRLSELALSGYKDLTYLLSPLTRAPLWVDGLDLLMFGCGITDDAEKLFEASLQRLREGAVEVNDKDGKPVPEAVIRDTLEAGCKKYVADVVPYYESLGIIR